MHDTYVVNDLYVVLGPLPTYTLSPTHTASKVDINYDTLHYTMKYYMGSNRDGRYVMHSLCANI